MVSHGQLTGPDASWTSRDGRGGRRPAGMLRAGRRCAVRPGSRPFQARSTQWVSHPRTGHHHPGWEETARYPHKTTRGPEKTARAGPPRAGPPRAGPGPWPAPGPPLVELDGGRGRAEREDRERAPAPPVVIYVGHASCPVGTFAVSGPRGRICVNVSRPGRGVAGPALVMVSGVLAGALRRGGWPWSGVSGSGCPGRGGCRGGRPESLRRCWRRAGGCAVPRRRGGSARGAGR